MLKKISHQIFHFVETEDKSPSLKLKNCKEMMHSGKGAFSETLYVYLPAIKWILQKQIKARFLVFGMGLGFIEILIACEILKNNLFFKFDVIHSFEKHTFLKNNLLLWLGVINTTDNKNYYNVDYYTENEEDENIENFIENYDKIISFFSNYYDLLANDIKKTLANFYFNKKWKISAEFSLQDSNFVKLKKYNCVLYDFFCNKVDNNLWEEKLLNNIIKNWVDNTNAVFSSYAAVGNLKRVLIKNGFILNKRKGFAGKKESTLAFIEKVK